MALSVSMLLLASEAPCRRRLLAQTRSNTDRFSPPMLPTPAPLPAETPTLPTPAPLPAETAPPIQVAVTKIIVVGSTVFKPEALALIGQPLEGKSVTLDELRAIADAITQKYLEAGFITSRAVLEPQTIDQGLVTIRVIEGSLEQIEVEGLRRLRQDYVTRRVRLAVRTPLNKDALEDQLRLLKADPLFTNVEASLKSGQGVGKSNLVVRVRESNAWSGSIGADNYSPPSVGSERLGATLNYRNVTGRGDELSASYYRSTPGGSNAFDFNYRLPINAMNGTLQVRIAPSSGKIIDPEFAAFGIRSQSQLYEISYRQPLIRTSREEFALSGGFSIQNGQSFLFENTPFPFGIGPDSDGKSRTRVLKFGQDYLRRDAQGAWALRSQFSFGLGILGATINADPIPDGRFVSWLGQIQRVQRLSQNQILITQADIQLSPNTLLPAQQFVIGGGQSVRGYRQNARSGDSGFRVSLEDRIALARDESGVPTFQIAPFIDVGSVWNRSNNPNPVSRQRFLVGLGLGLIWEPVSQFSLRADYGRALVQGDDQGNNAQDEGFYFSVGYRF